MYREGDNLCSEFVTELSSKIHFSRCCIMTLVSDETAASFVTAADESFPVNPIELSDQTIGADVSQEDSDQR